MEVIDNTPKKQMPPANHLIEAILVTIFCCLPFGIVAIIYAAKVEGAFYAGDEDEALRLSQNARKWSIIGLICGLVAILLYILMMILGVGGRFTWSDMVGSD